ncbi:MAG: GNAT family N-acetyltransferase [Rhodospirillaceae bacterium]|nr:GNAT family N-acetyltransferase [Rhodospirillaceae bacterium]
MKAGEAAVIRPVLVADAAGIARVHVAAWRDTYPNILPAAYLVGLSAEVLERRWRARLGRPGSRSATFVAEDPRAGVAGYATCGPHRARRPPGIDGEFYEIYVDPAAQGCSIGRRLVAAMAAHLLAHQMRSACVRVLRDNPTCWFYRHLAGRLALEDTIRFAGVSLPQQTYTWPDPGSLERLAGPAGGTA